MNLRGWRAKLGQNLTTEAAGGPGGSGCRDHHDFTDFDLLRAQGGHRRLDGHPLGTDGPAVGGVLDVAARKNPAVFQADGGSDLVAAVGAMGVRPRYNCLVVKVFPSG